MRDTYTEGTFGWTSNPLQPAKYTHWYPGEPNDYLHNEDCVAMYADLDGVWNDANCSKLISLVCEIPLKKKFSLSFHSVDVFLLSIY